jgi:hypothetical protein
MDPMDRKADSSVEEPSYLKVKPAFRVTLVGSSLRVAGCPDAVMVMGVPYDPMHVTGVEAAVEKDRRLLGF